MLTLCPVGWAGRAYIRRGVGDAGGAGERRGLPPPRLGDGLPGGERAHVPVRAVSHRPPLHIVPSPLYRTQLSAAPLRAPPPRRKLCLSSHKQHGIAYKALHNKEYMLSFHIFSAFYAECP